MEFMCIQDVNKMNGIKFKLNRLKVKENKQTTTVYLFSLKIKKYYTCTLTVSNINITNKCFFNAIMNTDDTI